MTFKEVAEAAARHGVVPALLGAGVLVAGISAGQVWSSARSAAYGGFWSGVLASFAVVLGLMDVTLPAPSREPEWLIAVLTILGVGTGTMMTFLYLFWRHRKLVAFPLACQTLGALSLLYLYFIWPAAWLDIAWFTLGVAGASSLFYALGRDLWPRPLKIEATDVDARSSDRARIRRIVAAVAIILLLSLLPPMRVHPWSAALGVLIVSMMLVELGFSWVQAQRGDGKNSGKSKVPSS